MDLRLKFAQPVVVEGSLQHAVDLGLPIYREQEVEKTHSDEYGQNTTSIELELVPVCSLVIPKNRVVVVPMCEENWAPVQAMVQSGLFSYMDAGEQKVWEATYGKKK